jgi:hypothetical protein
MEMNRASALHFEQRVRFPCARPDIGLLSQSAAVIFRCSEPMLDASSSTNDDQL